MGGVFPSCGHLKGLLLSDSQQKKNFLGGGEYPETHKKKSAARGGHISKKLQRRLLFQDVLPFKKVRQRGGNVEVGTTGNITLRGLSIKKIDLAGRIQKKDPKLLN